MTLENLAARVQHAEDVQEILSLENRYGYLLDAKKIDELIDLFSDNAESISINDRGIFYGKDGVQRFFGRFIKGTSQSEYGWICIHHQLQGVVDVAPDGKTACGRWYLLMLSARNIDGRLHDNKSTDNLKSCIAHAVYENKFVKENGIWKISKMQMSLHFNSPIEGGWTTTPVVGMGRSPDSDAPVSFYHPYPELELLPLHWIDEA